MKIYDMYEQAIQILLIPVFFREYLAPETGRQHGLNVKTKLQLAWHIRRATKHIETETGYLEIMTMVTALLNQPPSPDGCLVECGCYKGGTTACLSLVAAHTGQKVHAFDTFAGLPDNQESTMVSPLGIRERNFEQGEFESSLSETRSNVAQHGNIDHCEFHEGLFSETLPNFDEECAFIFIDVDLRESLETCIEHLWPSLISDQQLYTHEAHHEEISMLFYDHQWWADRFDTDPPTLIGAGTGIGLYPEAGSFVSQIGYTVKRD
jgi:hypothetical protein